MKNRFIPYNKNLKDFARELRNNSTMSEILFWMQVKGKGLRGYQFNRQKPLDNYIADFYCKALDLVIEIDGYSHGAEGAYENDQLRDSILRSYGLHIIRIDDRDVKRDMANVLRQLGAYIDDFEASHPGLLSQT